MNWDKATNLTILFLLLMNLFLGALLYNADRKYYVTQAQHEAVSRLLSRNGIELEADIPKQFRPMRTIRIQQSAYDANKLVPAFFGSTVDVTPDFYGQLAYSRGMETLIVDGDSFIYENATSRPGFVLNQVNAVELCNRFISEHASVVGEFVLDRVREIGNGYELSYVGRFRQYLITSNTMVFYITADGISRVDGRYNHPLGFAGEPKNIISPDEALYIFVRNINYVYGDREITLDGMDVVYHLSEASTDRTVTLNASPYYRFSIFSGDVQVMINAYTGAVYGSVY